MEAPFSDLKVENSINYNWDEKAINHLFPDWRSLKFKLIYPSDNLL